MSSRVAESIAADLRKRILRGDADGEPLPRQDDLTRQYGVSGPSLREALRILEAEGLITVRRGKFGGAYVHKPDWSSAAYALALSLQGQGATLTDLARSLLVFEPMCAAGCASRPDRAETIVPELKGNLADTEARIGDSVRFSASARRFHDLLVGGLAEESLRLIVRSMVAIWSIQEQIWAETVTASAQYPEPESQREAYRTHAAMLRLIEDGDVEGARRLSVTHLEASQAIVLKRFGGEVVDASSLAAVQAFKSL
ncbi:FadR/GntR family transcriptional regulator [Microbacterium immunditiarum]|uniref:DNA-binding FadR family transcriptional regulator n=1 Tax=Microbacterium immunditiarum TaxID=337480 RepID=A0A7Y9GLT2_9MICO|nr:GntR family transcriptional regulator [Microbacterium immunditiarum]NYE18792.1 DNA-binding FadR family transcriptional regulator [Microbacterium immunditiarum]